MAPASQKANLRTCLFVRNQPHALHDGIRPLGLAFTFGRFTVEQPCGKRSASPTRTRLPGKALFPLNRSRRFVRHII